MQATTILPDRVHNYDFIAFHDISTKSGKYVF